MKSYYVYLQGNTPQGPFPESMVRDAFIQGIYNNTTRVCEENSPHWRYIANVFPPETLYQHRGSRPEREYTWKERILVCLCFLFVYAVTGRYFYVLELNKVTAMMAAFIIAFPIFECYDFKRRYGVGWSEILAPSLTFWGISTLCLFYASLPSYVYRAYDYANNAASASSDLILRGENMVMLYVRVFLCIAICVRICILRYKYRIHLLRKNYKNNQ